VTEIISTDSKGSTAMSHDKHEHPHGDDAHGRHSGGEREGFLDKVKDFFTGGDDDRVQDEDRVDDDRAQDDAPVQDEVAEGQAETDSVTSAGSGGAGSRESGWDGSDEPPELTVPENEAVAAHAEATSRKEGDAERTAEYESRHGGGVDDSGVLADAPSETRADASTGGEAEVQTGSGAEAEADGESDEDSESGADREQREAEEAEERRRREEEFAREHDPETHDLEAGEEFRQRGDWTADEHGGPQVQEPGGTVHSPDTPVTGIPQGDADQARGDRVEHEGSGDPGRNVVRDGGHGWGSAAPLEGGGMPLGHPVKAWHDSMTYLQPDSMTYLQPGEDGYEGSDAHEWFVDAGAAERAGFRHAHDA
jgi:hypothetical protein